MSEQQAEAGSAHHRYKSTINKRMNRDAYKNFISKVDKQIYNASLAADDLMLAFGIWLEGSTKVI